MNSEAGFSHFAEMKGVPSGPYLLQMGELLKTGSRGCLCESAIKKLAGGEIPDPGLSLCLGHLASCPDCSDRLDRELRSVTFAERLARSSAEDDAPLEFLEGAFAAPEDSPPGPALGEGDLGSIGRYRITGLIGRGLSALTWAAFEPELDRHVAVKMLRPAFAADPDVRSAFLMEARAMAAIHHEGIVPVHTVDEAEGVPFLVMPLLEGESLGERLSRGPLNRREARRITLEVASALRAAHACGLVHRDVKPSNIWIRRKADGSESAMLLDFGVALPSEAGGSTSGSAGYKSPEQSLGAPCDPRTDCFALGCVVFEMLTGRKAWPSSQADLAKLTLPAADPAVPTAWRPLLRSLLSLDPAARPATMEEVAGLVPPEARPWGALVACGLMLALMLAFGVGWMLVWKPGPRPGAPSAPETVAPEVPRPPVATAPAGLKPRLVLRGDPSMPAAVSSDGKVLAMARSGGLVELFSTDNGKPLGAVNTQGPVRHMALDFTGAVLVTANPDGKVTAYKTDKGDVLPGFDKSLSEGKFDWGGAAGDSFLMLSGGRLTVSAPDPKNSNKWLERAIPNPPRTADNKPRPFSNFAICPNTNLVAALVNDQSLSIHDVAAMRLIQVQPTMRPAFKQVRQVIWKNPATCAMVYDRQVVEVEIREKGQREIAIWELPRAALAFAWVGEAEFAMVSDGGGKVPTLALGRRGKRETHTELDTGGAWVESLAWIPASLTLAPRSLVAYCRDGSARFYTIPAR